MLLLAVFTSSLAMEHVLEPRLAPVNHMVSEYANGSTAIVMDAGFVAWCASFVLLAWRLRDRMALAAALGVAAVGVGILAAWHTQAVAGVVPDHVRRSAAGQLHDLGGELVIAGCLAAMAQGIVHVHRGQTLQLSSAVALAAGTVVTVVLLSLGDPAPGLRQRWTIAVVVAWQTAVLVCDGDWAPGLELSGRTRSGDGSDARFAASQHVSVREHGGD